MSDPSTPNTPSAADRSHPLTDLDPTDASETPAPEAALKAHEPEPSEAPSAAPPKRSWTDYDWAWNILTVTFLVLSGSFMTNTAQAFSQGNWDILQTLSTVGQGAGLALVSGGALTSQGRETLEKILSSLGIQPKYQAEVSCIFAAATLGISAVINTNLPRLGEHYYQEGESLALSGREAEAVAKFEEALHFLPNDVRTNIALGNYYEQSELHKLALSFYVKAVDSGDPLALMGIGRIHMQANPTLQGLQTAELFYRLALAQPKLDPIDRSQLLAVMGIVKIRQAKILRQFPPSWDQKAFQAALEQDQETSRQLAMNYLPDGGVVSIPPLNRILNDEDPVQYLQQEAQSYLTEAAAIEEDLVNSAAMVKVPGYGMPYCYLGILYDELGEPDQSDLAWTTCSERAVPASLAQMAEILSYGGSDIVDRIDTSTLIQQADDE